MKKRLGIIGGMGAAAGVRMAHQLVSEAQSRGATQDRDFPDFIYLNLPSKGTDVCGVANEEAFLSELQSTIGDLEKCGCHYIIIACNSAYALLGRIPLKLSRARIISIVEAACDAVDDLKCVGVLCSQTTRASDVYQKELKRRRVKFLFATEDEQRVVDEIIAACIAGKQGHKHTDWLENITHTMIGRGADRVILGCTELPLCPGIDKRKLPLVDAGAVAIKKALLLL